MPPPAVPGGMQHAAPELNVPCGTGRFFTHLDCLAIGGTCRSLTGEFIGG